MSTTEGRVRRSAADWEQLARDEILPALQAGEKLKDVAARYANGYTNAIRRTLTRMGYDTKGRPAEVASIDAARPGLLAEKIAKQRAKGVSWRELEQATGKSTAEMKAMLAERGYEDLTHGRGGSPEAEPEAA